MPFGRELNRPLKIENMTYIEQNTPIGAIIQLKGSYAGSKLDFLHPVGALIFKIC